MSSDVRWHRESERMWLIDEYDSVPRMNGMLYMHDDRVSWSLRGIVCYLGHRIIHIILRHNQAKYDIRVSQIISQLCRDFNVVHKDLHRGERGRRREKFRLWSRKACRRMRSFYTRLTCRRLSTVTYIDTDLWSNLRYLLRFLNNQPALCNPSGLIAICDLRSGVVTTSESVNITRNTWYRVRSVCRFPIT